jgi:hypothetical protein
VDRLLLENEKENLKSSLKVAEGKIISLEREK